MNIWELPEIATIGDKQYAINTDFRDVLEIIQYLNNESKSMYVRWKIAVSLFYDGDIPEKHFSKATEFLADFIAYDSQKDSHNKKLIDWQQDSSMIISDINKVAGKDVRSEPKMHWWTFLSYFYGIGEGQLSTIVGIRAKKAKGKKLEKWEQEYYRENRQKIDFQTQDTEEKEAIREYFNKWL